MSKYEIKGKHFLLNKLVLEIRFEESILYRDVHILKDIQNKLHKRYPETNVKDNEFTFINRSERKNVSLSSKKISIIDDSPLSISELKQRFIEIIDFTASKLEIHEFSRIGFRSHLYQETEKFTTASEKLKQKLEGISDVFKNVKKDGEIKIGFSFFDNDFGYSINLIPRSEVVVDFDDAFQPKTTETIGLVYDTDIYSPKPISNNSINAFIKNSSEKLNEFVYALSEVYGGE